jgi:hypothetical protein
MPQFSGIAVTHGNSTAKTGLAIVEASGGNSALVRYYCQMIKLIIVGAQGVQTQDYVVLRAAVVGWPVTGGEREERVRSRCWEALPKASLPLKGGHVAGQTYQSHTFSANYFTETFSLVFT